MNVSSPLWLEIDLNAVQNNCIHILRDTQTPLMAIVKADAYGHGAAEVAQAAVKGGAAWLGVARFGEARELRQHGIRAPILVLGAATSNEVDEAIACDVALALYSFETLELYAARARRASLPLKVHLKIETGMGRLGVFPEDAAAFTRRLRAEKNILIDGVFSHLAAAEEADNLLNALQLQRFQSALDALKEMGMLPRWIHLANSAAAFYLPQSRFNLIRVGNVMLGLRIRIDEPLPAHYKPALTWKARLVSCRRLPAGWSVGYGAEYAARQEEWIGVVPAGYGDGLRRVDGNAVLIGGEICPAVGRLCLDQTMVRLPRAYPIGEEVVIIGRQGARSIWVHDLAALYRTSQVDVTSLIHRRVPRIFLGG